MQIELIVAFVLLLCAVSSFALEKIKMEVTAIGLLGLILLGCFFGHGKMAKHKGVIPAFNKRSTTRNHGYVHSKWCLK